MAGGDNSPQSSAESAEEELDTEALQAEVVFFSALVSIFLSACSSAPYTHTLRR